MILKRVTGTGKPMLLSWQPGSKLKKNPAKNESSFIVNSHFPVRLGDKDGRAFQALLQRQIIKPRVLDRRRRIAYILGIAVAQ
ncbi:hypothetical protein J6590_027180 [Homalodisca vitripennis]|nr:hypothetical protein J6590_027180 [Homalodisca vitripennis]